MEAILGTCCGLDVHRDEIVACLMKGPLDCKPTTEIQALSGGWRYSILTERSLSDSTQYPGLIEELKELVVRSILPQEEAEQNGIG